MAGMRIPGRVSKAKKKLRTSPEQLQRAIEAETENILDPQEAKKREAEIRDLFFTARKKTKGAQSGILMGLFGEDVGQALANRFFKEDPEKIKESQKFFEKYKTTKKEKVSKDKFSQKQLRDIANIIGKFDAARMPIQKTAPKPEQLTLKKGFYYDPELGARGGIRNVRTGRIASQEEAIAKRKERTEKLTKAIGADEEPLVLLKEKVEDLYKNIGVDSRKRTIHEKLDDILEKIEGGGDSFVDDLFGLRGLFGGKTKGNKKPKRGQPRDSKGRFTKKPSFGFGSLLAGGLGSVIGAYLASEAVESFRDKDLKTYDPEVLKQEAVAAKEVGDTEYQDALKMQIEKQKTDVALRAGKEVATVAGAGVGAVAGVKIAQKVGQTAPAKKVANKIKKKGAPAVKRVKSKVWNLFIKFLEKRSPTLFNLVKKRIVTAGVLSTVPVAGWVAAAISLGFALSTAYDLYQLWKEFSALSDAEKEAAASGKPSKEVNDWAYSVFLGKQTIDQVPEEYREQVNEILENPPSNWKKPGEAAGATAGAATEKPKKESVSARMIANEPVVADKPLSAAQMAAIGTSLSMGNQYSQDIMDKYNKQKTEKTATEGAGVTGPAAAVQAAKKPAMIAGGGGGAPTTAPPVSKGPTRRLSPAAVKRGKIDPGAAKNAALAAAAKYGITGPHLAQFMAQLEHESGGFATVEENLRYSAKRLLEIFPKYYKDPAQAEADAMSPIAIANRVYANRMGNGPPESGDGYRYRGRGLIQLTGKDNYKRFGQLAGVDLVSNPDMAGNLGTAADIAAAFYKKNIMDKGIAGEDTAKVTKAINGGSIGLSHRESLFASYMKDPNALKAGPEAPAAVGETKEEPSLASQGQDVKVGAGGGAEVPTMAASTPTDGGGATVAAEPFTSSEIRSDTRYEGSEQVTVTRSSSTKITPRSPTVTPKQDTLGVAATQQSNQQAANQVALQATPPPVIVNNTNGGTQQPITPPKQNLPKASARSTDNAFNRAIARDFSHPSSFTSVGLL